MSRAADTTPALIPLPASVEYTGKAFTLNEDTTIVVDDRDAYVLGEYLIALLKPATGYDLHLAQLEGLGTPVNSIYLSTIMPETAESSVGKEGYKLLSTSQRVMIQAHEPAGLFYGIQTLRQLLPAAIESDSVQAGPWTIPSVVIEDTPRFEWRGAMLDVSRHFFGVEDVKRYIDLIAAYKINRLHLHLADDQGWRIEIKSWPNLAEHGGQTEVGGGEGGYYTQEQYAELVAYAESRFIIIIPEIDMPGHTNAALSSYPELNCDDKAPDLYTGTEVGFSTLCIDKEITYDFIDDVVRELSALTPGAYIHIGGDEAKVTPKEDYIKFMNLVQEIVATHGKQAIGWEEIAQSKLLPTTIAQHWWSDHAGEAVEQGAKVIMSPATKAYLDMKYESDTPLGLTWAAIINVETAYNWDPATQAKGVAEENILGVEAPLWSETLETIEDIEFLAFPRLPGYAEIGWTPQASRDWETYQLRLAAHGPRFAAMGINYYASDEVQWGE